MSQRQSSAARGLSAAVAVLIGMALLPGGASQGAESAGPLPQPRPARAVDAAAAAPVSQAAPAAELARAGPPSPRARPAPPTTGRLLPPTTGRLLPPPSVAIVTALALPETPPAELRNTAITEAMPGIPRSRPKVVPPAFNDPFAAYGREPPPKGSMVAAFIAPPAPPVPSADDDAACRSRLAALGVQFKQASGMQFASAACSVAGPLNVSAIGSELSLKPEATLNCRTTEALAIWMRDVVVPAARKHLGSRPTGIAQASAYVCRPRNNQRGAKLSEHATGNAVDIASIGMEGRAPLDIRARGASEAGERAFQAEVRQGACRIFTTVLGPGSNAAHATHLHFDMAQRRGGYRLCE